jgi:hypothetical protein
MTYPHPTGYYSLNLDPSVSAEIEELDRHQLKALIEEVSRFLNRDDDYEFQGVDISDHADRCIGDLSDKHLIKLLRWLSDRLDCLV